MENSDPDLAKYAGPQQTDWPSYHAPSSALLWPDEETSIYPPPRSSRTTGACILISPHCLVGMIASTAYTGASDLGNHFAMEQQPSPSNYQNSRGSKLGKPAPKITPSKAASMMKTMTARTAIANAPSQPVPNTAL